MKSGYVEKCLWIGMLMVGVGFLTAVPQIFLLGPNFDSRISFLASVGTLVIGVVTIFTVVMIDMFPWGQRK